MTISARVIILLLLVTGLSWAQGSLVPEVKGQPGSADVQSSPSGKFEETQPPKWTPAEVVEPGLSKSDDPLARKLEEVNSELDRVQNTRTQPSGAASTAERTTTMPQAALKALGALFMVLALIFALSYLFRKFGRSSSLIAGSQLAQVIGKVYLAPRVSLHFVRTGGKVLIVGVAPNGVSLLTEADANAFEDMEATEAADDTDGGESSEELPEGDVAPAPGSGEIRSFLDELKADLHEQRGPVSKAAGGKPPVPSEDEDIDALRKDLQRLQRYLQESTRGGGKE